MLHISEMFKSVQGEGITRGIPSVFLRMSGCNLMCGGHSASLVKEGKANWWCDSEIIWKSGKEKTAEEIVQELEKMGDLQPILEGKVNLILTGGEPTIPRNAEGLIELMEYIWEKYPNNNAFVEIETNGSIWNSKLFSFIDQINCSPKLANSGMPEMIRIKPDVLKTLNTFPSTQFKFVISSEKDWEEIERDFLPYIDRDKIVLMPAVDNFGDVQSSGKVVWEMAQRLNLRMTLRDHITIFNKTVGV